MNCLRYSVAAIDYFVGYVGIAVVEIVVVADDVDDHVEIADYLYLVAGNYWNEEAGWASHQASMSRIKDSETQHINDIPYRGNIRVQ